MPYLGKTKQLVLVIFDGWGLRDEKMHNAIASAKTPCFDRLWKTYPHSVLEASGLAVGLPEGQIGNSEVGHSTIGLGGPIDHDLVRITKAARANEFDGNPVFKTLFEHVKKNNSVLHVKGLLSPGGVHSHQEHLHAFLAAAKKAGVEKVAIHAFMDGRDKPPQSGHAYLEELEKVIEDLGIGFIATASGRYYAMDRDTNWDRIARAEDALFYGKAKTIHRSVKPSAVLRDLYAQGVVDEHLEPIIFLDDTGKNFTVGANDGVLFFNFRSDRTRQLSQRIAEHTAGKNVCFVTMTEYDKANKSIPALVAFPPFVPETNIAKELSAAGFSQARIAETEKYAHVTFFINGGSEKPYERDEYILVESRKDVPTHDLAPEMRAEAIVDTAIEQLDRGTNFIIINIANADMVGHTAKIPAIITALEFADRQLERLYSHAEKKGAALFITADHGNAELSIDADGVPHTAHTTNPVPGIITIKDMSLRPTGTLADVAPTILGLFGVAKPSTMTGESLVV